MALLPLVFIWIAYVAAVALVAVIASVFTHTYQAPRDRSVLVSVVAAITLTLSLATSLLLPVDVALVSSTAASKLGAKKDWATPEAVENILLTLRILYYTLYSLDAILCLLVVPFTYFLYEEYDPVESEEGRQSFRQRFFAALKYTLVFIVFVPVLFIVGFLVPIARTDRGEHWDLDYFKHLLAENHGERALTFIMGLFILLGTLLYMLYTAVGFARLPISFIKPAPSISNPQLSGITATALEQNQQRQRQLEALRAGRDGGLSTKDQRELEALIREERTLVRRERLAAAAHGEGGGLSVRAWARICAASRPLELFGGVILLVLVVMIWASMLTTLIDKAMNSICKQHCGYILGSVNVFQPVNWILVRASDIFPVDFILMALLVLLLLSSSVVSMARIGIRFLWVKLFEIRKARTPPQAILVATVLLSLITLAINYSITTIIVPQYAIYGAQTFCQNPVNVQNDPPDCSNLSELIRPCSELSSDPRSKDVCTPTVMSTFLNRMTLNFPILGALAFWAQSAFLAVFLAALVASVFRVPKLNLGRLDEDAEADEEEALLSSTSRRLSAT